MSNPPELAGALDALLAEVEALAKVARGDEVGGNQTLEILARCGPQTVPQIARMRNTSRQNSQVVVNRLEREGYVETTRNPAHKRSDLVSLTAKGKEVLEHILERKQQVNESLYSRLGGPDVAAATTVMRQIRDSFEAELSPKAARGKTKHQIPKIKFQTSNIKLQRPNTKETPSSKSQTTSKSEATAGATEEEEFPIALL
ncbi:MAG: hypothetical protein C5B50_27655 [Verrucomicrobia bacterium]|nr:MAG: hypothetical protein C5B50_27655 [Verrucomicrobiota bacterium]